MEEEIQDSKKEADDEKKNRPVIKNAMDLQRLKLEKLMKNPDKPMIIPELPKERDYLQSVPTFVRNVMGSSAGAGSGEFHVYRNLRRKEYARQKFIEVRSMREQLDQNYQDKLEKNRLDAEEKTAKKRAKRQKKKQNQKHRGKKPRNEVKGNEPEIEEFTDSDDEKSGDDTITSEIIAVEPETDSPKEVFINEEENTDDVVATCITNAESKKSAGIEKGVVLVECENDSPKVDSTTDEQENNEDVVVATCTINPASKKSAEEKEPVVEPEKDSPEEEISENEQEKNVDNVVATCKTNTDSDQEKNEDVVTSTCTKNTESKKSADVEKATVVEPEKDSPEAEISKNVDERSGDNMMATCKTNTDSEQEKNEDGVVSTCTINTESEKSADERSVDNVVATCKKNTDSKD